MNTIELDNEYIAHTYARLPVVFTKGKGAKVWDENGKEYIDLGAGIAVNTFGYSDEIWAKAVKDQADVQQHTSNLYYTEPCVKLAKMLCEKTGMKKVFFCNSGAEANECAIKTARKWAYDRYGDESHSTIITLKNSFHGRTVTTLAATGQDNFHTIFGPFTPGFAYASATDPVEIEEIAKKGYCCAVMIELIQGEGGVNVLSKEYVNSLVATAKKYDLLIITDEVQTGNGRTGTLYAYMQYGFVPDILTTAKGLAGGLPLGACLFGEKTKNTLGAGTHGSTFGANPVCCAGALSILSRLDEELLCEVEEKGKMIKESLENAPGIKSVSGLGMMIGAECEKSATEMISACLEKGVVTLSAHGKIRLLPPLSITKKELEKALSVIKEAAAS